MLKFSRVAGRLVGNTVGTVRKGRVYMQRFIREHDVNVGGVSAELQETLSEVRAIRGELTSISDFSPRMLEHGASSGCSSRLLL